MEIQRLENLIVELKKEKSRIKSLLWYLDNKEKSKKNNKKWYLNNKDKHLLKSKIWHLNNPDKVKIKQKKYMDNHKNEKKIRDKKYSLTEKGKKNRKINRWKDHGLIGNYNEIYERYLNTENCDNCNVKLTINKKYNTKTTKCMDHNHITGEFRNILCHSCNIKRG